MSNMSNVADALRDHEELQNRHDNLVAEKLALEHQVGLLTQERDRLREDLKLARHERDFYMQFTTEVVVTLDNVKDQIDRLIDHAEQQAVRKSRQAGASDEGRDDSAARLQVVKQGPDLSVGQDTDITKLGQNGNG